MRENDIDSGNQCKRYYNGEITSSKYIELEKINKDYQNNLSSDVSRIKDEAITYIGNHPDLKSVLEEINVDEDFYLNEHGGTTGNGRVYFTK